MSRNVSPLSEVTRAVLLRRGEWPSAASLSIEPFEVSRLRLRRTRQQHVWILNGVLVPERGSCGGPPAAAGGSPVSWQGWMGSPVRRQFAELVVSSKSCAHVEYPGAPARVTGQEEESFKRCSVHVLG